MPRQPPGLAVYYRDSVHYKRLAAVVAHRKDLKVLHKQSGPLVWEMPIDMEEG